MSMELRRVREWADKHRHAAEARDAWIVRASEKGHSLREIAEAAGLSHGGVAKIVARPVSGGEGNTR